VPGNVIKNEAGSFSGKAERMKILFLSLYNHLSSQMTAGLSKAGYEVDCAGDPSSIECLRQKFSYICYILETVAVPSKLLDTVRSIRIKDQSTPIIIIGSDIGVTQRVDLLRFGVDDYLVTPFEFIEFLARLEALLRRRPRDMANETRLIAGDIEVDLIARSARRRGQDLNLLPKEFDLLQFFLQNPQEVFSRSAILDAVWGARRGSRASTVDVHVSRLRRKLDTGFDVPVLRTFRGRGYAFDPSGVGR
jgi:two-component system OmpR family response regulator